MVLQEMRKGVVVLLLLLPVMMEAFAPSSFLRHTSTTTAGLGMMDPSTIIDVTATVISSTTPALDIATSTTTATATTSTLLQEGASSTTLLSFADQGQNLAGLFFQASLLPYLFFLYFLQFRANRLSDVANFGFQFILLFVVSTIPSGIISKLTYGSSLADVDWLHGGAELLLTTANILIVLGLKEASTNPKGSPPLALPRNIALGCFGVFIAAMALGPSVLGFQGHSAFVLGLGNLPTDLAIQLPWVTHMEPANALSIPTWVIHFSSVLEYLVAMNLVWKYAKVTGNETWKGLTWGMLPLHASGICACTYHFFYNPSSLQFLVTMQAGFTCLGNLTCAIAAFRIANSNGWSLDDVNPFPKSSTSPQGLVADGIAATPLAIVEAEESNAELAAKVVVLTLLLSYGIKYGELALDLPFEPNGPVALLVVLGIPAYTAYTYYQKSEGNESSTEGSGFKLPSFSMGDNTLSMADVKKYGVSGTVAYVITELAFWIVAFPVAAVALYKSTGHWPDVINETNDRGAVLAFIFAGANVARAFVPVRLGAALALAPWVDENILGGKDDGDGDAPATTVEQ